MTIQSFKYDIVDEVPYRKPAAEYLMKLYDPTTVATQLNVMSHHENRCPPIKKSFVERVNRAK